MKSVCCSVIVIVVFSSCVSTHDKSGDRRIQGDRSLTNIIFTAPFDNDTVELYSNSHKRELMVLSTDDRIGIALEKVIYSASLEKDEWVLAHRNQIHRLDSLDFYKYGYVSKVDSALVISYSNSPILFK